MDGFFRLANIVVQLSDQLACFLAQTLQVTLQLCAATPTTSKGRSETNDMRQQDEGKCKAGVRRSSQVVKKLVKKHLSFMKITSSLKIRHNNQVNRNIIYSRFPLIIGSQVKSAL